MEITTGPQTVTATGPLAGTLDTSALTVRPVIRLIIPALTAGATARIAIEDTASSTEFSDAQAVAVFDVTGPIGDPDEVELSITPDLTPSMRFGATHNQLRANVTQLTGSSPSLTAHAFAT
jgi:hypothetical protein